MSDYQTIVQDFQEETIIKKSRFIVRLKRISSEEEASKFIESVRKEEKQANHNVYAYLIGDTDAIQRASDDGEPSQTAGAPALQALLNLEVHDVVAVVTRYFGGVKLGASGLIRAYHGSVVSAIKSVGRVVRQPMTIVTITLAYPQLDAMERALEQAEFTVQDRAFTENVTLTVAVPDQEVDALTTQVEALTRGQGQVLEIDKTFVEVPLKEN